MCEHQVGQNYVRTGEYLEIEPKVSGLRENVRILAAERNRVPEEKIKR